MGQPDNLLAGKAWQAFVTKYREGDTISGQVRQVGEHGVLVTIEVAPRAPLSIRGLIPRSNIDARDVDRMYVLGQKVQASITGIWEEGEKGRIALTPTQFEIQKFLEKYRPGSTVGGEVVRVESGRVRVLLHDIDLPGELHRDEMFPCCQKDLQGHFSPVKKPGFDFPLRRELKLCIEKIINNGAQWEIRLKMQRISYAEFVRKYPPGSLLDGTVHAKDHTRIAILLDAGIIGTVPAETAIDIPEVGRKARVRVEHVRPEQQEIGLSLQETSPCFGRVYWAEDKGIFTPKPFRDVVVLQTQNIESRGWSVGRTQAIFLSATSGALPYAMEEVCFLYQEVFVAPIKKRKLYPLQRLQNFSQCYRGELPEAYQQALRQALQHSLNLL
jgi:hypothetical protein